MDMKLWIRLLEEEEVLAVVGDPEGGPHPMMTEGDPWTEDPSVPELPHLNSDDPASTETVLMDTIRLEGEKVDLESNQGDPV